jgi:hypothetical protein
MPKPKSKLVPMPKPKVVRVLNYQRPRGIYTNPNSVLTLSDTVDFLEKMLPLSKEVIQDSFTKHGFVTTGGWGDFVVLDGPVTETMKKHPEAMAIREAYLK